MVDIEGVKADLEKIGKTVEGQFAIATLIKKYLLTLPDPLIPFSLYDKFMDATLSRQEKMRVELLKKVSKELSMPRYQTLKALTQLFHKIQLESNVNQMTPGNERDLTIRKYRNSSWTFYIKRRFYDNL